MATELYERCPVCGGSGFTLQDARTNKGTVISRGAPCPACDRGYVPSGLTAPDVLKKRRAARDSARERRREREV
jgi:transcriptional regulator NrdR family protein